MEKRKTMPARSRWKDRSKSYLDQFAELVVQNPNVSLITAFNYMIQNEKMVADEDVEKIADYCMLFLEVGQAARKPGSLYNK